MTLAQIESLLQPIWNRLYEEGRENIPKSFFTLMTKVIPKYKDYIFRDFQGFRGKSKRKRIINVLRKCQADLIELELLDKDTQNSLNGLIKEFSRRPSVKEQIESYSEIGKKEIAFTKDIGKELKDISSSRFEDTAILKERKRFGDFKIHTHTPLRGKINKYHHIPHLSDLLNDFEILKKNPNTRFVIVATNNQNKVTGYFIYKPSYEKDLSKIGKEIARLDFLFGVEFSSFVREYKRKLKNLGISYTYKTRAIPGYYWDDKDKVFKKKPK